jgi:hypothetical protein
MKLYSVLVLGALSCATDQNNESPPEPSSSSTLHTIDRFLEKQEQSKIEDTGACLERINRLGNCPAPSTQSRTLSLEVVLDSLYIYNWKDWSGRLSQTMRCVNTLFRETGLSWEISSLIPWDPGPERHELAALLRRLQKKHPPDENHLVVGITVWNENRIYARAGGEIGLSQGGACVIPSWPRIENDCLILTHELGHLVGARHVPGKNLIMNWAAHTYHLPATDPTSRVIAAYRFHPRNLSVIRLYKNARLGENGLSLPQPCLKKIELIDSCWRL